MGWNNDYTLLTTPIGFGDISYATGVGGPPYDLGNMIKNGTTINMWSRRKPIKSSNPGILTETDFHNAAFGLVYANSRDNIGTYTYDKPTAGQPNEWFRALDFDEYRPNVTSGLVWSGEYTYNLLGGQGQGQVEQTVLTMYDTTKICLNDIADTIFAGYQVRLLLFEMLGTATYYWYSDWKAINTSGYTYFDIPFSVLVNLPTSDYDLFLEASPDGGTTIRHPLISKGTLHLVADSGITISGWGYSMTAFTSTNAGVASTWQTGPTTNYMTATGSHLGFSGLTIKNNTGSTINQNNIRMHLMWQNGATRYYLHCPTYLNTSYAGWSLANGSSKSISTVVRPSDLPKFGDSVTAVSIYIEAAVTQGSTTVYSRLTDVITLNILRTDGGSGVPMS